MNRVFLIVLDSCGIGALPDAKNYGDEGSNTWKSCWKTGLLTIPNLEKLGLYHIDGMDYKHGKTTPQGCCARLAEKSSGKDTTIGHWEISGIVSTAPLPVYPQGFPPEVLAQFTSQTGCQVICNRPYSGSEVIKDYGREHEETGKLIVYTSADSVFQIAAHESRVSIDKLYEYCETARSILIGKHGVGRVIARPFTGTYPNYMRTLKRHDFSLEPPRLTVLDALVQQGKDTIGVGKIYDIFAGRGILETYKNEGNAINMERAAALLEKDFNGLCFVNLVDFDMMYGHRRDVIGYMQAINAFDKQLGEFLDKMKAKDMLVITADHGCDPCYSGTDHTREYTPCICYGKELQKGVNLGTRESFADIAATIADALGIVYHGDGNSFWHEIL